MSLGRFLATGPLQICPMTEMADINKMAAKDVAISGTAFIHPHHNASLATHTLTPCPHVLVHS